MPSFRFCRPDDRELLIHAINTCAAPHDPDLDQVGLDEYQRLLREENFWAGNCMLALGNAGDDVLAGVFGGRRGDETAIMMLGARPGEEHKGYVSHLITSLNNKLAILGPPNLRVEIPAAHTALENLFRKLEFSIRAGFADYVRSHAAVSMGENRPVIDAITVEQLEGLDLLREMGPCAWIRQNQALKNIAPELTGLAIVSAERVEAFVLYRKWADFADIRRVYNASPDTAVALAFLIDEVQRREQVPLRIRRLHASELSPETILKNGFAEGGRWLLLHRKTAEL